MCPVSISGSHGLSNDAVPGYDTGTTNNLRLWGSKAASGEFDFQKFNSGEYESSVADQQRAETISAVLYPNDKYVSRKHRCR
jgi:glucan phosphorylase